VRPWVFHNSHPKRRARVSRSKPASERGADPEGPQEDGRLRPQARGTIEATTERFQVDAKTVTKWRNRFLAEGLAGLQDRSSRLHRSPNKTPESQCRRVIELRKKRRWGAEHIGHELRPASSTVQSILNRAGHGRLDRADRAPASGPVQPLPARPARRAGPRERQEARRHPRRRRLAYPRSTRRSEPHRRRPPLSALRAPASTTPRSSTTRRATPRPSSGGERMTGSR
jgi:hypothetical protein